MSVLPLRAWCRRRTKPLSLARPPWPGAFRRLGPWLEPPVRSRLPKALSIRTVAGEEFEPSIFRYEPCIPYGASIFGKYLARNRACRVSRKSLESTFRNSHSEGTPTGGFGWGRNSQAVNPYRRGSVPMPRQPDGWRECGKARRNTAKLFSRCRTTSLPKRAPCSIAWRNSTFLLPRRLITGSSSRLPSKLRGLSPNLRRNSSLAGKTIGCKERTLAQYRSYTKVICAEFGSTKVARIAQADIEDWLSESEWAPRTRKNYLVTLMTLFEWARDRGYLVTSIGGT